ncbi:MAG: PAS domain S-box protein [Bacillota bacterium]
MQPSTYDVMMLYDIVSFAYPKSFDELFEHVLEKSVRLLGVSGLALAVLHPGQEKTIRFWGFRSEAEVMEIMGKDPSQVFTYNLSGGKMGFLLFKQAHVLSHKDKRLYNIFSQRIEDIVQRKLAEQELRKSEYEKATILDGISTLIIFQNLNNDILWVNRAAAESVGKEPKNLIGKKCYEVWHQRSEPCVKCPVIRAINSGIMEESYIVSHDGKHWDIKGYPVKGESDQVESVIEVAVDNTAYYKTQKALESSQRALETIFNNINDAIFVFRPDGAIFDVNEKMMMMFGVNSKSEAIAKSFAKDYSCSQNPIGQLPAIFKKVMRGKGQVLDWRARRPSDGVEFQVEIYMNKLELYDEELILATVRDITASNQDEKMLRNMFVHSPIGMYVARKGTFYVVNQQFANTTGYSQNDLVDSDCSKLVHPSDRLQVKRNALKMLKGQQTMPYEFRLISKQGEIKWVMETVTSINYLGKRAVLGSVVDITERKAAEKKLHFLSFHDSVTGLYNRAFFEEELKRLDVSRNLPLSIIMGDVNGLKLVNDAFGHYQGDKMLMEVARALKTACRKEDIICRWGGDEFAVLLPKTDNKAAEEVCLRIKHTCGKALTNEMPLSISLGTATKVLAEQNCQEVIKQAEDRMYHNKLLESKSYINSIISSLQTSLAQKTSETEEHARRMKKYALKVGKALDLSADALDELYLLAALHDIGKIAIPETIINSKRKLSNHELEVLNKHCEIGSRIAQASPELAHIAKGILSHHEYWDGTGYPQGLKGEDIPLLARIIAIVDAYDVMTNGQVYKKPISGEDAVKELIKGAGKQFDPDLVKVFIKILDEENLD